jgi:hypothetical protein
MTFAHYIGIAWQAGAQGPEAFDCMAFFRHVQKRHFGVEMPEIIAPDYENPEVLTALFRDHEQRQRWLKIGAPKHGCAVLVHRPMHIGIWLDIDGGGVLHCVRASGVIFSSDSSWPVSGFGRKEFFALEL